jgi:hypothetical protein
MEEAIETEVLISHNMGYFIFISFPYRKIDINVRDYQTTKMSDNEKVLKDSRVVLVNMLDALLK